MNILVLDDEKEIADLVELYLKNENYDVYKFYTANEAIHCIDTVKLDLAILFSHHHANCENRRKRQSNWLANRRRRLYNQTIFAHGIGGSRQSRFTKIYQV